MPKNRASLRFVSFKINEGIRISGKDRYDTSAKIAQMTDAANMVLVSGDNFADALSSVNIANAREADVVLAPRHMYRTSRLP